MTSQMLFFFSALGAFNSLVLSLYFAISADHKKKSNNFLALLLMSLSIRIIKSVFFHFNPNLANIFIQIGLSACTLIGPFLFLFLKAYVTDEKPRWIFHTIPYLICISLVGIFYSYTDHRGVWSKWLVKGIYCQWLLYILASFKFIQPILTKVKKKENLHKTDIWLLSIYFGVLIIWMAYNIASYTSYIIGALSFTFVLYLIILLLIFKSDKYSTFSQEKEKYKNKELDPKIMEDISAKLITIKEKEFFLNPNFTLEEAAKELKVPKHILSQYLNEKLGKSFSTLINEYRIEKVKKLLETEKNMTIESIGYDSGFNSKSTFFTTFKKITGQTPTEYQKAISK